MISLYCLIGVVAAPIVSFGYIQRLDPATMSSSLGFKLTILPGIALLWPVVISRLLRGAAIPEEKTAHKKMWGAKHD